jgi:hypothetical protein
VALGVLLAAGAAVYLALRGPAPQAVPAVAFVEAAAPAAPPALPPPEKTDPEVRQRLATLTPDPELVRWLREGADLARRLAAALAAVSEGESPRPMLGFLAPSGDFAVREEGGHAFMDPAGHARYATLARVLGSLDGRTAAEAYRALEPLLEAAYAELAPPGAQLRTALGRAITRLRRVPVPDGKLALVPRGAMWAYADPALEALSPAEKHLLRLGSRTQRLVQEKLGDFARELKLELAHGGTPP